MKRYVWLFVVLMIVLGACNSSPPPSSSCPNPAVFDNTNCKFDDANSKFGP